MSVCLSANQDPPRAMRQPLSPLPRRRAGHALFPCLVLFGAPAATALLPVGGVRWTTSRACARCAALAQRQPAPVRMEHAPSDSLISAARTISIAAAIFFFVRSFLVEPYFIPSSSMAPTLNRNDHIAVEKFSKYLSPPHRGDIFVFTPPAAFFDNGGKAEADEPVVLVEQHAHQEAWLTAPGLTLWVAAGATRLGIPSGPDGSPLGRSELLSGTERRALLPLPRAYRRGAAAALWWHVPAQRLPTRRLWPRRSSE
jgi:hypothetical protein